MAFESGDISILGVAQYFGYGSSTSLSQLVRGGGIVPATRINYSTEGPSVNLFFTYWAANGASDVRWGGTTITSNHGGAASYTVGNVTYYRDYYSQQVQEKINGLIYTWDAYAVRRVTATTVSINTGVPSALPISLSQLRGVTT